MNPKFIPPEANWKDGLHTTAKAVLNLVPFGGSAAELFQFVVQSPLEKRMAAWRESVGEALSELTETQKIDVVALQENEKFVSFVLHTTQIALRSHQQEKLVALRNALVNSAISEDLDENLELVFLNMIDRLTPWHIKVLGYLNDPKSWWEKNNKEVVPASELFFSNKKLLQYAFPELQKQSLLFHQILSDLTSMGLLKVESISEDRDILVPGGFPVLKVTQMFMGGSTSDLGIRFIGFISENKHAHSE